VNAAPVRPCIAVVDDDDSVREALLALLAVLGFDARPFASARAFLDAGAASRADCLLVDVMMPGMSGPQLMRQPPVRARGIPVVFITGMHDEVARRDLLALGAVDCLFKPFGEAQLLRALRAALRRN